MICKVFNEFFSRDFKSGLLFFPNEALLQICNLLIFEAANHVPVGFFFTLNLHVFALVKEKLLNNYVNRLVMHLPAMIHFCSQIDRL